MNHECQCKCPWCGSECLLTMEHKTNHLWDCQSHQYNDKKKQSFECAVVCLVTEVSKLVGLLAADLILFLAWLRIIKIKEKK